MASTKNRNNTIIPIGVMAVLLVGLYFINRAQNPPAPTPTPPPKPAAPVVKGAASPEAAYQIVPAETSVNEPATAKTRIQLGWEYDPTIQTHPEQLKALIQMLSSAAGASEGRVSFTAADLDLPPDQLSPASKGIPGLGIYINGKPTTTIAGKLVDLSGNPGTGTLVPTTLGPILPSIISHP